MWLLCCSSVAAVIIVQQNSQHRDDDAGLLRVVAGCKQHSSIVNLAHSIVAASIWPTRLLLHQSGPLHTTFQAMSGHARLARLLLLCAVVFAADHCCCCCFTDGCVLCLCRMEPDEMEQVLQQVPVKLSIVEKTEGCWEVCVDSQWSVRVSGQYQDSSVTVAGECSNMGRVVWDISLSSPAAATAAAAKYVMNSSSCLILRLLEPGLSATNCSSDRSSVLAYVYSNRASHCTAQEK
jgi:hypothetical protein